MADVTAAYSLDSRIAEAQAEGQGVRLWGRAPGQATIVLVHPGYRTSVLQVRVIQAPPILPDIPWGGLDGLDSRGYYEVKVSSDPTQVSDAFDYRTNRVQLHLSNANLPGQSVPGIATTRFLFSYLRFSHHQTRLTLLDEDVESSPLSLTSTLVRGLHFETGGMAIHAGYTSIVGFQSLLFPTEKQLILGTTLTKRINPATAVGATSYFIQPKLMLPWKRGSTVETVFLNHTRPGGTGFSAELGWSNGVALSTIVNRNKDNDNLHADVRYRPRAYATPDTDNLTGLQGEGNWNHLWNRHLATDLVGSGDHTFTRTGSQTVDILTTNLHYKTDGGFSLSPGVSVSRFSDQGELFPDIRRLALPVVVAYDRPRFGASAQYQYSLTSHAFSSGHGYRGSLRWNGSRFQVNGFAGSESEALGVDSVFSAFPALNAALASLGLGANTSVDQLTTLLQNRTFLSNLGVAPDATIQLVPRTWYGGLNSRWASPRQTLEFEANYNRNLFLTEQTSTVLQTVRYSRGISHDSELLTSFTLLDSIAHSHRWDPICEVSLRHQFRGSPLARWRQARGDISGTVSVQDNSGFHPLPGAEIRLDDDRRTTSDSTGVYRFSNVSGGLHTIEMVYRQTRPFWYTAPSKQRAAAGSSVDFGIVYPVAQLIGYVVNDADVHLSNITLLVKAPRGDLSVTTDQTGKFVVPVAQTGEYTALIDADTVPNGYALDDLKTLSASLEEGQFKKLRFTLRALRGVSGVVESYDAAKGAYVRVPGVAVQLAELQRQTTSDSDGHYSFRNLPAGKVTLVVSGKQYAQVVLGSLPQNARQDIRLNLLQASGQH